MVDEVFELFPVPVQRCRALLDAALLRELRAELGLAGRSVNAKSGALTHSAMMDPAALASTRRLSELVTPKLVAFGTLLFGEALRWSIKEMWANVLEPGGQQSVHAHANSFISGIVYLTESHASARTVFAKSVGGNSYQFDNTNKAAVLGKFNAGKWMVPEIAAGDMLLFPSYLLHEVPRNQGASRMTIAFNAIPDRLNSWGYEVRLS